MVMKRFWAFEVKKCFESCQMFLNAFLHLVRAVKRDFLLRFLSQFILKKFKVWLIVNQFSGIIYQTKEEFHPISKPEKWL